MIQFQKRRTGCQTLGGFVRKGNLFDISKNDELLYPDFDHAKLNMLLEWDIFSDEERQAIQTLLAARGKATIEVLETKVYQVDADSPEAYERAMEAIKVASAKREKLFYEAKDPCSIPLCTEASTITVNDKPWCDAHAKNARKLFEELHQIR